MLNTLKVATNGYLKRAGKVALVIAVAGWLNFSSTPITPTYPSTNPYDFATGTGGRGISTDLHSYREMEKLKRQQLEMLQRDDAEIFQFIKIFLECQS